MDHLQKNNNTGNTKELNRKKRKEIGKWNQMTALRFQTGKRHQTSPASPQGTNVRKSVKIVNIAACVEIFVLRCTRMD